MVTYCIQPVGGVPITVVHEVIPGVVVATWDEAYGIRAHLVEDLYPGAQRVFFENGPPPGSREYAMEQEWRRLEQERQRLERLAEIERQRSARRKRLLLLLPE